MKVNAAYSIRTLKNLLLFAAYIAALWSVTWYNFHFYSGTYNTIITDFLLTLAFIFAFFLPMAAPKRFKGQHAAFVSAVLCAAALLFLFLLRPSYTVADGYRILEAAHYENVQLDDAYVQSSMHNRHFPVSAGITFRAQQGQELYEILFNPASGDYNVIT